MSNDTLYVPVLKGKEGEFAALEALSDDVRLRVTPLIEIPPVPYDFINERPAKDLEAHVKGFGERFLRCWADGTLYLDLPWFGEEEHVGSGRLALEAILAECVDCSVKVIPVISRSSSAEYLDAAAEHAEKAKEGLCIRLAAADFEEDVDLESETDRILDAARGIGTESIDLVLDLEDLGPDVGRALLVVRSIFSMVPRSSAWRRLILAAASFPEDLSGVDRATTTTLPRREWELWNSLQRRPNLIPRKDIVFGDYAIAHPLPKELDPRTMRMSASIRYTTRDNWLVLKGRNVRQYGFDQYFELCKILVDRPEFCGADFSWGDNYIAECALERTGPGNATTWRKVGTNHHLTLVARTLASHGA